MTTPAVQPFDLVIFDLDGTLVDSAPDITWSLNATLAETGFPTLPIETVVQFVGDGASKLIERALPPSESGRDPSPLVARYIANYARHLCVDSRLYPGVADLLASLSRAGVRVAMVTNKPGVTARGLVDALGIAGTFAHVLGDGDGFPRKPDPAAAHSIIARVGTSAARTVVVGDGLPDIRMARAIPCAAIAVAWGYTPLEALQTASPSFVAHSADEVSRLLLPGAGTRS